MTQFLRTIHLCLYQHNILLGQNTIHVPLDYATIQLALNSVNNSDTLLVAPGNDNENLQWPEQVNFHFISSDGSSETIIAGGGSGRVINIEKSS